MSERSPRQNVQFFVYASSYTYIFHPRKNLYTKHNHNKNERNKKKNYLVGSEQQEQKNRLLKFSI